jgi:hypothetical protein
MPMPKLDSTSITLKNKKKDNKKYLSKKNKDIKKTKKIVTKEQTASVEEPTSEQINLEISNEHH